MDVRSMLEDLQNEVELSEAEKAMVEAVVMDTTMLTARLVAGEDVTGEFALVKATALNLAEAKRAKVQAAVNDMLMGLVTKAMTAAFAAL